MKIVDARNTRAINRLLTPPRGDYVSMTVYEPVGKVLAITPWNSPLSMTAQKVAPALAAGNAVIVKPSEITTLTILELGRTCVEAGLPAGTLSVLAGDRRVGEALVNHPGVDLISFTGGTEAGRAIALPAPAPEHADMALMCQAGPFLQEARFANPWLTRQ